MCNGAERIWEAMCVRTLLMAAIFSTAFMPGAVHADDYVGFEVKLPINLWSAKLEEEKSMDDAAYLLNLVEPASGEVKDQWSINLTAGKDSVINRDKSTHAYRDGIKLNDGSRIIHDVWSGR